MTREEVDLRLDNVDIYSYGSEIGYDCFSVEKILDDIYSDFEKQLEDVKKEYYILGSDANYKALKDSGCIKELGRRNFKCLKY